MSTRARWLPLIVDRGWNPELRKIFDDASGAYAIRHKATGTVEYVGESHTGRGWTTLTRHFQDASGKFAVRNMRRGGGQPTWTREKPGDYEAALWVTSRGARKKANADEGATKKQAELIEQYKPPGNIDDGKAKAKAEEDADDYRAHLAKQEEEEREGGAFASFLNPSKGKKASAKRKKRSANPSGAAAAWAATRAAGAAKTSHAADLLHAKAARAHEAVAGPEHEAAAREHMLSSARAHERVPDHYDVKKNDSYEMQRLVARASRNPPKLVDVPLERRADARTPDLWTGKTKLEEGGKASRRDWKGEAERLQRELVACRSAAPSTEKPASDTKRKKQEFFVDERGQGGFFRNPSGLIVLGWLVSIAYRGAGFGRTAKSKIGRRHVLRWGVRNAPIVAYDPAKGAASLVLIFEPVAIGASSARAAKEYKRTHWGQAGEGERLEGDVLRGKAARLGTALEITYATAKGSSELVDWHHTFGDFGTLAAKKPFIPPAVHVAQVDGRELVRLEGGTYTVTAHGIVG